MNIFSNDKQVILYNYFTPCLKHTSHFSLLSELMLLNAMELYNLLLFLVWRIIAYISIYINWKIFFYRIFIPLHLSIFMDLYNSPPCFSKQLHFGHTTPTTRGQWECFEPHRV